MHQAVPMETNFLAALLHGRRSRLAEDGWLDTLCRIRTVEELGRVLYPQEHFASPVALQRRMVLDYFTEMARLAGGARDDTRGLLAWLPVRVQIENLKVLARGRANRVPPESLAPYLLPLPGAFALDAREFLEADSLDAFLSRLPNSVLRAEALRLREIVREPPGTFFLEAVLDAAYLGELGRRAQGIRGEDAELARTPIRQEIDAFLLMLAARGQFQFGLKRPALQALYVEGGGLTASAFAGLLDAPDLPTAAARAVGVALDAAPAAADPAALETLAWNRLYRLANRAFRRGTMGMGAVVGYTVIRRLELANRITLCEGIRAGLAPADLRARMLPRSAEGGGRV